jgi:hypothetical protein
MLTQFPCPCCGYLVFIGPPGTDEICPVCVWQDDVSQLRFPKCGGGANKPSLIDAQKNFLSLGVGNPAGGASCPSRDVAWRPIEHADLPPDADGHFEGRPSYPADLTELYYWRRRAVTKTEARQLAQEYISRSGLELALLDQHTIERDFGWVFFYNSKRYIETGDFRDALAGNAPIVVMKTDGSIHVTGTAHPIAHYLKRFEGSSK